MSDEMMVQNQRPSAVPYFLGGAAVGAGAGWALTKYANFGFPGAYAANAEEAIARAKQEIIDQTNGKDTFVTKRINNTEGEVKSAWEKIQANAKAVNEAEKALQEAAKDVKDLPEFKTYLDKYTANESAIADLISGKTKVGDKSLFETLAANDTEATNVWNRFKELGDKEVKIGENTKKASEVTLAEFKGLKDNQVVKDFLKENAEYRTFAEAQETEASKALKTALDKLKDKKPEFAVDSLKEKIKAVVEANKKGNKELTSDLLGKCKAPKMGLTIAAGAAVLGLLSALILRPKAKDNA